MVAVVVVNVVVVVAVVVASAIVGVVVGVCVCVCDGSNDFAFESYQRSPACHDPESTKIENCSQAMSATPALQMSPRDRLGVLFSSKLTQA